MNEVYVESNCVFEIEGRQFESGGAYVSPDRAVGYCKFEHGEHCGSKGTVVNWHGTASLGVAVIKAKWRTPKSFISSHQFQIECRMVDGRLFTGRTGGNGMVVNLKLKRSK